VINNRWNYLSLVAAVLAVWLGLTEAAKANPKVYRKLLLSTGWVVVPGKAGLSVGTCFVVDRERRLVITCRHVIGECEEALIYFPTVRDGAVTVEGTHYLTKTTARVGQVIAIDREGDLALLRLPSLPEGAEALPLASANPEPGSNVHSIGNSSLGSCGALWRYTRGEVRLVYNRRARTPAGERLLNTVETQAPVNRGDSGGAMVNDAGELVAVVTAYSARERLVSHDTGVREVRRLLAGEALAEPEQDDRVIGRWKVSPTKEGEGHPGEMHFNEDGTYSLAATEGGAASGRFAYVNGVLWMVRDEKPIVIPVTWSGRDRFAFKLEEQAFRCDRHPLHEKVAKRTDR
jgi:hypothetical protein